MQNRRTHDCEQEGCTKQTKARFCEEHLPRCTYGGNLLCGKKCRKFEDPATAVCFNHSQYLRDKTREKVARYRARDRERRLACNELSAIIRQPLCIPHIEWEKEIRDGVYHDPFRNWLRENYHDLWLKQSLVFDAHMVIEGLSGDELREYTDRIIAELN